MSIDALIIPMLKVPVFAGLKPGQLKRLAISAERVVFVPGEAMIERDRSGDRAFLIVDGTAVLEGDGRGMKHPLGPGTLIGEMAMLTEVVHQVTVRTLDTVRTLSFSRDLTCELFEQDASLAEHFLALQTKRLTAFARELRMVHDAVRTVA